MANLARAPQIARDLARCALIFESPLSFLRAYVTRTAPSGGVVRLRTGLRILLSDDPLDVVTIFGLFVRKDYGDIPRGSRVMDLGANIGVFTLYAVHCGAAFVHAYEPSGGSYRCLLRNIEENCLGDRVRTFQAAVGKGPERTIPFPRKSSVLNRIPDPSALGDLDCDHVPLETLPTALGRLAQADFIKIDCEGEEERIIAEADAAALSRIKSVRLEYHLGRGAEVAKLMTARGFFVEHWWAADANGGLIWFAK